MKNEKPIEDYNYKKFLPPDLLRFLNVDGLLDEHGPWESTGRDVNRALAIPYSHSPTLGAPAPDFPLWDLDGNETTLSAIWEQHTYTVVEFGSFT